MRRGDAIFEVDTEVAVVAVESREHGTCLFVLVPTPSSVVE